MTLRKGEEYGYPWMPWHRRPPREEIVDEAIAQFRADLRRLIPLREEG